MANQTLTLDKQAVEASLSRYKAGLTPQECNVITLLLTGDSSVMELDGKPNPDLARILQRPAVAAVMSAMIERFLQTQGAAVAISTIYSLMSDKRVAPATRLSAANTLLNAAGWTAKRAEAVDNAPDDTRNMSAGELRAQIDKLQKEIDGRALDITPKGPQTGHSAPVSEPLPSEVLELFE